MFKYGENYDLRKNRGNLMFPTIVLEENIGNMKFPFVFPYIVTLNISMD